MLSLEPLLFCLTLNKENEGQTWFQLFLKWLSSSLSEEMTSLIIGQNIYRVYAQMEVEGN